MKTVVIELSKYAIKYVTKKPEKSEVVSFMYRMERITMGNQKWLTYDGPLYKKVNHQSRNNSRSFDFEKFTASLKRDIAIDVLASHYICEKIEIKEADGSFLILRANDETVDGAARNTKKEEVENYWPFEDGEKIFAETCDFEGGEMVKIKNAIKDITFIPNSELKKFLGLGGE